MSDTLSIALSGLKAQQQSLNVTATNIANAGVTGTPPGSSSADVKTVFKPLQANLTAQPGGGVTVDVSERKDGVSLVHDPSSPYANSDGFIAVPNVDFGQEAVNALNAKTVFKANISVIKAQEQLDRDLLDIIS